VTAAILLVEDTLLLAFLLEDVLPEAGFEVLHVPSGAEAIVELENAATTFKAIITDVDLGIGPDGWEVARRARAVMPAVPVVYATGQGHDVWTEMGMPGSVLVSKPYDAALLAATVSAMIDAAELRTI
jgi:DNA-binding response OmpR family regulator